MRHIHQTGRFQNKHWITPNIHEFFLPTKTSFLNSVLRHGTFVVHSAWLFGGRWGCPHAVRLLAFTAVFVAISYSTVTVALNIESASGSLAAGINAPVTDKSVPRPKIKPVHVESLLSEKSLPQCGYGKIENMMSGSCEWATRTTLGEAASELADDRTSRWRA